MTDKRWCRCNHCGDAVKNAPLARDQHARGRFPNGRQRCRPPRWDDERAPGQAPVAIAPRGIEVGRVTYEICAGCGDEERWAAFVVCVDGRERCAVCAVRMERGQPLPMEDGQALAPLALEGAPAIAGDEQGALFPEDAGSAAARARQRDALRAG